MEQEDNPAQRHQAQQLCAASCGQSRINSLRRRNESCHKRALSFCGCELAYGSRRIRPENGLSWSCSLQRAARSRCPVFAKQSILIPVVSPPSAPGPIAPPPKLQLSRQPDGVIGRYPHGAFRLKGTRAPMPSRADYSGESSLHACLRMLALAALPHHSGHNLLVMSRTFQLFMSHTSITASFTGPLDWRVAS